MRDQYPVYCKRDGRRIGQVPSPLLWTGAVAHIPTDPEDLLCLTYLPCETCRREKRNHWHRYEIEPPNPIVRVHVPVILSDEAA